MNAKTFLNDLQTWVTKQTSSVENEFSTLELNQLNYKPGANSWSILECLEHLNRYSRYYLPLLQKAISGPLATNSAECNISYTWLGKYSINMVKPANIKKNKTLKHMNPNNSLLTKAMLEEFLQHQQTLSAVLIKAQKAELNRKAIPVEFMRFLKMKTGESLEFLVSHQERHIGQAQKVRARLPLASNALLMV